MLETGQTSLSGVPFHAVALGDPRSWRVVPLAGRALCAAETLFVTPQPTPGGEDPVFSPPFCFHPGALDLPAAQGNLYKMTHSSAPLLEMKNVSVVRGENLALDRLSLRIGVGEHVCILGPNGCGKSTLIRTITRENYPLVRDDASMTILGQRLWNVFELRTLLGIVSPDLLAACTTEATGLDVVLSGFFSSTRIFPNHAPESGHRRRAEAALARLNISYLAGRPVVEMSSGEAKRTLIARALVHEPQTLLFDEPSNALDITGQVGLRETMRELARSGLGILLVTHHVSEIIPEIERVVLMQRGRIVADGRKAEILTNARLGALFGVPVRLFREGDYFHLHA